MVSIGKIKEIPIRLHEFHWEISGFFSISLKDGHYICSPQFSFADASWCLMIYPNGSSVHESIGYIGMYLWRKSSGPPIHLEYCLGLQTVKGHQVNQEHQIKVFENTETASGVHKWLSRADLMKRKSQLMSDDVITLICNLKDLKSTEVTILKWLKENCKEVATQTEKENDDGSLGQDFKKLLLDGLDHNLILKVGDKELRAHRDILRIRSKVFESMLSHDMIEENSGVIDIPDCDPQAMEQFLTYVYSGKVDILDQSNMLGLYYIADKYESKSLKDECCNFIKESLTPTNFCDVIQLALNHSDSSLLEYATEYFLSNVLDILQTVEWQRFLKNNSTVANELLIKSYKKQKI